MAVFGSTAGLVLVAWLVGVALLAASYAIAGDVWRRRHSLHLRDWGLNGRVSGAYGEAALLALGALTLVWVDAFTREWSMLDMLRTYWPLWLVVLAAVTGIVIWYSCGVPAKARQENEDEATCRCLARTYCVYGIYSTLLFFGGWVLVGMLVSQFLFDFVAFSTLANNVVAETRAAAGLPAVQMLTVIESTYLDSIRTLNAAQDQMSPVFVFAASIFVFNFLILATPIQDLFLTSARVITHATTIAVIVLILFAGGLMYVTIYSSFIENYVTALMTLRPSLEGADWQVHERFNQIVFAVDEKQSLVGFISEMSNEWGGLAAIFGIGQWVVDRLTNPARVRGAAPAAA